MKIPLWIDLHNKPDKEIVGANVAYFWTLHISGSQIVGQDTHTQLGHEPFQVCT